MKLSDFRFPNTDVIAPILGAVAIYALYRGDHELAVIATSALAGAITSRIGKTPGSQPTTNGDTNVQS